MSATLTWLDLTASDRDRMRQVLDLFKEQGTVDEMGLGSLRDALSEALFPGTSTIQTRLRYVLFVPWIYRQLEAGRVAASNVSAQLQKAELDLIGPLLENGTSQGVIGERSRGSLSRRPSSVYWTALVRWGLFMHERPQGWYHTHFTSLVRGRGAEAAADDPGIVQTHQPNWHPRMPGPPPTFPQEASFDLTRSEAVFLQGRLEERCAGTLLAWLAREGSDAPADGCFWDDSAAGHAHADIRDKIELARRFSLHVEGMALLYNLLLAERFRAEHGGDDERVDHYRQEIAEWSAKEALEDRHDPRPLWSFAASRKVRVPGLQRLFVETWSKRLADIDPATLPDDLELRSLIETRERQLKGPRARLHNAARLLDWNGRVGVGRMDFRWHRVRRMLLDLQQGITA
ncbi:MAG: hypothetical protein F4Y03_12920 [Alphaproteobacteria bacterium]|nr:hypothetical protein [Alphaproteobacteria bacterium]